MTTMKFSNPFKRPEDMNRATSMRLTVCGWQGLNEGQGRAETSTWTRQGKT